MYQFYKKSLLFILPIVMVVGLPAIIFYKSGEFYKLNKIIDLQQSKTEQILFGPAYSDRTKDFKLAAVIKREPEIIALGTSRVMQIKSEFFKQPNIFYNAGEAVAEISDFNWFLNNLPTNKQPKVFIISLDPFFFNDERVLNNYQPPADSFSQQLGDYLSFGWREAYFDYFKGKFSLAKIFHPASDIKYIGLNALIKHNGFRNDGSYNYGEFLSKNQAEQEKSKNISAKADKIDDQTNGFEYGKGISSQALIALEEFLQNCKNRQIEVIGFMPPYAEKIYQQLLTNGGEYKKSFQQLPNQLNEIFKKQNFVFKDYSSLKNLASTDAEMIDAAHGSEKVYLRILLRLSKEVKILQQYLDPLFLEQKLDKSSDNYQIF